MYEIYLLWAFRLGIFLILLGILLPNKQKKTILSKVFKNQKVYHVNESKVVRYFDRLTEHSFFKRFMLKVDSDEYQKIEKLISKSGYESGLHPNIIQLFRLILPPISFIILFAYYIVKITTKTIELNPSGLQQKIQEQEFIQGFVQQQSSIHYQTPSAEFEINTLIWFLGIAFLMYFVPEFYLKHKIKKRKAIMQKELPIIEAFIILMFETGNATVYDIIKTLISSTHYFKPYLITCLNEFYINPQKAIQNMADRVNDEEFQIICNGLKQAVDEDKGYTATFMKQHIDQIKQINHLKRESSIKKKPIVYVFLLALPLISVIAVWFYPWFIQASKMLTMNF